MVVGLAGPAVAAGLGASAAGGTSLMAGLGAAADFLGGIGGLFGGKQKRGPSLRDQMSAQLEMNEQGIQHLVRGYKAAGLHPLLAAGGNPGAFNASGSFGDSGPDWGERMASLGQGVSRAAGAAVTREERMMAKQFSLLQLENQQLQNDRLRSEIALMTQPGTPPGMSGSGSDADARYPQQDRMPYGFGDTAPLMREGAMPGGGTVPVYNDELGDNEVLQAATALGATLPAMGYESGRRLLKAFKIYLRGHAHDVRRVNQKFRRKFPERR